MRGRRTRRPRARTRRWGSLMSAGPLAAMWVALSGPGERPLRRVGVFESSSCGCLLCRCRVWASMLPEAARESLAVTGAPRSSRRRVHRSRTAGRQRNVEEVERTLATYVPSSVHGEAPSVVAEVMPVVQEWVAAAGPCDGVETRQMMWASAPMAVWLRKTLGSLDAAMLNDRNIEVWIHSTNRRDAGWQHLAQALLRRVGRAVNPDGVAQPKNIGRRPAVRAYDFGIEAVFRQTAELPISGDQPGRLWVPAATFGAGLNGIDAHAAQTGDLHELGDGRLAVRGERPQPATGADPRLLDRDGTPSRAARTPAPR